jgi:type IV pilus assembly protein PilW
MKAHRLMHAPPWRSQRGFSLVELMVANLVGLLVALALLASVLTIGRQFAIVGSGVAAQGSAQIALAALDGAASTAGAGLYANGRMVCPTWNAWNGSAMVADGAAMVPARIVNGGSNGTSDTLVFTGLNGTGAMPALAVMAPTLGANIKVSQGGNLALNDIALIGVPGSTVPCTLFQVTTAPTASPSGCDGNATSCNIVIRAANQGINPNPSAFSNEPTYGFTSSGSTVGPAVVMRIGAAGAGFLQEAFTIQCNSLVRFNAFANPSVPGCTSNPLSFGAGVDAIATGVVLMHAQYGVSDTAESDVVTQWVEASGVTWGGTPSAANVARIKALRVVLVTRSRQPDTTEVTSACTSAAGVVNVGPCSFQDAAAPVIDLSGTAVAAGKTWRHYRYRVFKAVTPLRNVIWSDA